MSNNTASVTVGAALPPSKPRAGVLAPKLLHRPGSATPLHAARSGRIASVSTRVAVDKKATVKLTVRDPRTRKTLTLQPGTRLATTTLKRKVSIVKTSIGEAKVFRVKALVPVMVSHGKAYQLVLSATGATGRTSTLNIRFLG